MTTDIWSWAHEPDEAPELVLDPARVAALLVVHRPGRWLSRTLVALGRLDHRPGRVVAVLNDDEDPDSLALLEKARGEGLIDEVLVQASDRTPGQAWAKAEAGLDEGLEWLWLLHDDLEPRRDSLAQLCRAAADEPAPDLVYPKLLEPPRRNHPDRLAEFGQTISTSGGRVVSIEPGELDQHQLEAGRVLGGSTAGLFVRRSAWQRLGGLDENYPLHRDGLDLGWRANQAGLRVVTCPGAALHHRRAGREGERASALEQSPGMTERLLGMRLVAAHSARPRLTMVGLLLSSLFAALGLLLAKNPALAAERLRAARELWRTRSLLPQLRAAAVAHGDDDVAELLPTRRSLMLGSLDRAATAVQARLRNDEDDETSLDDLTGDEFTGGRARLRRVRPATVMVVLLGIGALAAGRRLFDAGDVTGPQLLPAPSDVATAWRAWLAPEAGSHGTGAPWLALQALGSTLALGRPDWFSFVQQLLAVPFAALAALPLAGRLVGRHDARACLLAAAWGLALPLVGATAVANPGTLQLSVALPLAAWAWLRWWQVERVGSDRWRDPALFAIALAWLVALVPLAWPLGVAAGVAAALHRRHLPGALVPLVAPPLLLAGWLPRLWHQPVRVLTGAEPLAAAGQAGPAPGIVWWAALAVLVVLSLLAVLLAWRGADRSTMALAGLFALAVVTTSLAGRGLMHLDGSPVRAATEPWALLAVGLLLVLTARHHDQWPLGRRGLAVLTLAVASLCGLAAAWVVQTPTAQRTTPAVPAHVSAIQRSERASRALLVDLTRTPASWQLTSGQRPVWGGAEQPLPPSQREAALALASSVAAGGQDDLATRAAALGVAHLWVKGADDELLQSISNSPGLGPVERRAGTATWTVTGLVGEAQLHQGGQEPTALVGRHLPDGPAGRTLVLAEARDGRWRAYADGTQLTPVDGPDQRQAFELPAGEAELRWSLRPAWGALALQGLALAVLFVLAAPSNSSQPVRTPRRGLQEQ